MCGRALGGHMRAHGIGDDHIDDEDQHYSSDWEDKSNGNACAPSNKRMHDLRTNPNRLKSCKICANCGKEFISWKLFLEHGKCKAEDVDYYSLVSSTRSRDDDQDEVRRRECGWFKGKRTKRASVGNLNLNCPSSKEEDLANCLVMLSSARVDPVEEVVEESSSCASASREEDQRYSIFPITNYSDKAKGVAKGMFECKACKKSFSSHQALGGHRASHKKVKGCFAAKLDDDSLIDEDVVRNDEFSMRSTSTAIAPFERSVDLQLATPSKRKSKVHECSICYRIFSSGQALGGHKRCHWITSDMSTIAKFHHFKDDESQFLQTPIFSKSDALLDLNQPASTNDKNKDPKDHLSLEISTAICLQSWGGVYMNDENKNKNKNDQNHTSTTTSTTHHFNPSMPNVDEEVESKVKLAKLNDDLRKDLHMSGDSSSPWLQLGIGST
ncbi:Zinc finger protein zat2 [Thalictrum thalictroides]|uniref:Zinc finger protein zat2 n=1 Tax=Thalictrum thalictroides TaxID=46969 RepID=A0A7J6VVW3_THATH|nr:Zinc finger protein zat2 [Thalictrum thalictroides]